MVHKNKMSSVTTLRLAGFCDTNGRIQLNEVNWNENI